MNVYFTVGYLGSGKTTFIKSFLQAKKKDKNAVLVNDFGDLDVDGRLLKDQSEYLETITGGSVFCSCRSDRFADALIRLSQLKVKNILVEASGLANPFALEDIMRFVNEKTGYRLKNSGTVCLVDCLGFEKVLPAVNMVKMQAACADLILLNKVDLCAEADAARVENILREINPYAKIERTDHARPTSFEIEVTKKLLPANVQDLRLQKAVVSINGCSVAEADAFCKKAAQFCHRIKGILRINGDDYVYQYDCGKSEVRKTEPSDSNFLICLSCGGRNLREALKEITDNKFVLQG